MQGGSGALQQNIQQRVPNQGQFNGNPRGAYNTNFRGQGFAPSYMQQTNLGRYVPPTMGDGGRFGYNSNQWNNFGGYDYNLPGSYGSPQGGGQFAPMPGQFGQYMNPNMLSGNTFGYNDPFAATMLGRTDASGFFPATSPYGSEEYANYLRQRQPGQYTLSEEEWNQRRQNAGNVVTNEPASGQSGWGGMGSGGPRVDIGTWSTTPDPRNAPIIGPGNIFQAQGDSGMPPGKDGRPLQTGFAPLPGPRAPRDNRAGPMVEDIPAYDRPENRSYNMNALYQMMGGWG
jgi:hypothetical protein